EFTARRCLFLLLVPVERPVAPSRRVSTIDLASCQMPHPSDDHLQVPPTGARRLRLAPPAGAWQPDQMLVEEASSRAFLFFIVASIVPSDTPPGTRRTPARSCRPA